MLYLALLEWKTKHAANLDGEESHSFVLELSFLFYTSHSPTESVRVSIVCSTT